VERGETTVEGTPLLMTIEYHIRQANAIGNKKKQYIFCMSSIEAEERAKEIGKEKRKAPLVGLTSGAFWMLIYTASEEVGKRKAVERGETTTEGPLLLMTISYHI
jgi:hypothetical protein